MNSPDDEISDPLKPLASVCEPDERCSLFSRTLESTHCELSSMVLSSSVPLHVRQLFETAKNASLYSWFVYRFHQVAELTAYNALEMALKRRYGIEDDFGSKRRGRERITFSELLKKAQKDGLISDSGFSMSSSRIYCRAQLEAINVFWLGTSANVEPAQGSESRSYTQSFVEGVPPYRNRLAHGSATLHPNSRTTLRLVAEAINQLFEEQ